MLIGLDFYKIVFTIEIIIAEILFTCRLRRRKNFILRASLGIIGLLGLSILFPIPIVNSWYVLFVFSSIFVASIFILKLCYEESWQNLLFCAMAAYTLQHFSYELMVTLTTCVTQGNSVLVGLYGDPSIDIFKFDKMSIFLILTYLSCYVGSYWMFFLAYGKKIHGGDIRIKSVYYLIFICLMLIIDIMINTFVIFGQFGFKSLIIIGILNMLCCLLLMYAMFSIVSSIEMEDKIKVLERLYREENEQYALLKENIDNINIKCHDIRHRIMAMGRKDGVSDKTIKELEREIKIYDSIVKTGNETVDIILTEKSFQCEKNDIAFSRIVDGSALSFLTEGELYSLLGNALENAIEATCKVENAEERVVGLMVFKTKGLVKIRVKNSYNGKIEFDKDGLPFTSKEDKTYHGFGIKSIKYIVEKYDGDLFIDADNKMFELNIIMPLLEEN